jgi:hypothetical protein
MYHHATETIGAAIVALDRQPDANRVKKEAEWPLSRRNSQW